MSTPCDVRVCVALAQSCTSQQKELELHVKKLHALKCRSNQIKCRLRAEAAAQRTLCKGVTRVARLLPPPLLLLSIR